MLNDRWGTYMIGYFLVSDFQASFGSYDPTLMLYTTSTAESSTFTEQTLILSELTSDASGTGFLYFEHARVSEDEADCPPQIQSISLKNCQTDETLVFDISDVTVFDPDGSIGLDSSRHPTIAFRAYKWSIDTDVIDNTICYQITVLQRASGFTLNSVFFNPNPSHPEAGNFGQYWGFGSATGQGPSLYPGDTPADFGGISDNATGLNIVAFFSFSPLAVGDGTDQTGVTLQISGDPAADAFTSITFTGSDSVERTFLAVDGDYSLSGGVGNWGWAYTPDPATVFNDGIDYNVAVVI